MGFCEVLTIVFIVLKLLGTIKWDWIFVILPELIAFVIYIVIIFVKIIPLIIKDIKRGKKHE